MDAGRDKGWRGRAASVDVGGGVDVGARIEEKFCDLDGSWEEFSGDILRRRWLRCSGEAWRDAGESSARESAWDFL